MATREHDLGEALRNADDDELADLLRQRPDLARPVPTTLTALATRAATRGSASRALATLTLPEITTLEAIVILGSGTGVALSRLVEAVEHDAETALQRLRRLMLVLGPDDAIGPAPGVAEAIGPSPLGLGPSLATLDLGREGWPTTGPALRAVLADAPDGARRLLDALTWGPAVGKLGTSMPAAARWLLDHHVLHRSGSTEVVLPREVAIAARGGRLSRGVADHPPLPEAPTRRPDTVEAEMVSAADEILRQLSLLLSSWRQDPPAALRGGGLTARDVKALAVTLDADVGRATLISELAGMLQLIGHSHADDVTSWAPTSDAERWEERPPQERWATVVTAWFTSARVPWLAGTRTDRGVLRSTLAPDLHRPWAAPLRRQVLTAVAHWPVHAAPSAAQVHEHLAWTTPRSVPPRATIDAVLAEAGAIGLLGAGALTAPARTLLEGAGIAVLAQGLVDAYPATVDELIVQADLTGIVPGRPSAEVSALLEACSDVDSRGGALTVRFSADSIARALNDGWSAEDLQARLAALSRTPLPQPLTYLIGDVARRHRQVRIQPAASVIAVDDEDAALALLSDPRLTPLGLRRIGPTTLASDASALVVHESFQAAGLGAHLESADGRPMTPGFRHGTPARPVALEGPPIERPVAAEEAVATMRAGEARSAALLNGDQPTATPADDLALLHAAAANGASVRLVVAGNGGATQERVVRPLSVDGGRVRARDTSREAEITVATHRIVAVRPA